MVEITILKAIGTPNIKSTKKENTSTANDIYFLTFAEIATVLWNIGSLKLHSEALINTPKKKLFLKQVIFAPYSA